MLTQRGPLTALAGAMPRIDRGCQMPEPGSPTCFKTGSKLASHTAERCPLAFPAPTLENTATFIVPHHSHTSNRSIGKLKSRCFQGLEQGMLKGTARPCDSLILN